MLIINRKGIMSLDFSKPIQTRDGREVKQLTVFDCDSVWPIVGVLDGQKKTWTRDGYIGKGEYRTPSDLVNVPERVKHDGYMWVWRNKNGGWEFSSLLPVPPQLSMAGMGPYLGYIRVNIDAEIITGDE